MVDRIAYPLNRDEVIHSISVYNGITSAVGLVNQLKCSNLIGVNDFLTGKSILIMTGAAKWEVAPVSAFNPVTGDIDTSSSFSAVIAAGIVFKVLVSTGSSSKTEIGLPTDDPFVSPETLFSVAKMNAEGVYMHSSGEAGTDWPIGTVQRPVNNIDDAVTIASNRLLGKIYIAGSGAYTLNIDAFGVEIIGQSPELTSLSLNGVASQGCLFRNLTIDGGNTGDFCEFDNCIFGAAGFTCEPTTRLYNCRLVGTFYLDNGGGTGLLTMVNCEGMTTAILDLQNYQGGGENVTLIGFKGFLLVQNLVAGTGVVDVYGNGAYVVFDGACTSGTISVFGDVTLVNQSTSTVYDFTNKPKTEVPVDITAINASETDVFNYPVVGANHFTVDKLRLKCADPGANTVTVRLYELVNDVLTQVDSFDIVAANFATYHSLMDMFGLPSLHGDQLRVTVRASAGGPYAVTGEYAYRTA